MIIEFDKESVIDFAAKCNIRSNTPSFVFSAILESRHAVHNRMDGKDEFASHCGR